MVLFLFILFLTGGDSMVVTSLSSSKNVRALFRYVENGKNGQGAKREGGSRHLDSISYGFDETELKDIEKVFTQRLESVGRLNEWYGSSDGKKHVGGYGVVFSWDLDELSPDRPEDVSEALDLALASIEELYEGHNAYLVAQNDGGGGRLHVHAVVSNVHSVTGKALKGSHTFHKALMSTVDKLHNERGIRNKNYERDEAEREAFGEALTPHQRNVKNGLNKTEQLKEAGVDVESRTSKAEGSEEGVMLVYGLKTEGDTKPFKRRHRTLGEGYNPSAIESTLNENKRLKEAEKARKEEEEREAEAERQRLENDFVSAMSVLEQKALARAKARKKEENNYQTSINFNAPINTPKPQPAPVLTPLQRFNMLSYEDHERWEKEDPFYNFDESTQLKLMLTDDEVLDRVHNRAVVNPQTYRSSLGNDEIGREIYQRDVARYYQSKQLIAELEKMNEYGYDY